MTDYCGSFFDVKTSVIASNKYVIVGVLNRRCKSWISGFDGCQNVIERLLAKAQIRDFAGLKLRFRIVSLHLL